MINRNFLKNNGIYFIVFSTGAILLVLEVIATRILSPYFGNTIYSFSSVISVVLGALSLGYYLGGKFSDKNPDEKLFYRLILFSGLSVLFSKLLINVLLPLIGPMLPITTGALLMSVLLLFLPSILMGMLSPFAIKLQSLAQPKKGVGEISGKVFFWSTLGSILGSLSAGFILIPLLGLNLIFISCGTLLCLLGLLPSLNLQTKKKIHEPILIISFLLGMTFFTNNFNLKKPIYQKDGLYEQLRITEGILNNRKVRFFFQDISASGAIFLDSDEHVYEYPKYYELYKLFKGDSNKALVLGGGAYTIPKSLHQEKEDFQIDVVEIEPSLFELSKEYFKLPDDARIKNYVTDARKFLLNNKKSYDLIFSDVYHSYYSVPQHLTTLEFFQLSKSRLSQDGLFIANLIGNLDSTEQSFIMSEIKTFKEVFPNSYFLTEKPNELLETQNVMLVGYNSDKKISFDNTKWSKNLINEYSYDLSKQMIFTDDHAPVEYLISKLFKNN